MSNNILKELRKQGKTQFWLSIQTQITPQDISSVIHGKRYCFPTWKRKIAKALGVPEEELFLEMNGGVSNE